MGDLRGGEGEALVGHAFLCDGCACISAALPGVTSFPARSNTRRRWSRSMMTGCRKRALLRMSQRGRGRAPVEERARGALFALPRAPREKTRLRVVRASRTLACAAVISLANQKGRASTLFPFPGAAVLLCSRRGAKILRA